MSLLIDTHALLWNFFTPELLSPKVSEIIENSSIPVYVSAVSFWEISIKYSKGKLNLKQTLPDQLPGIAKEAGLLLLDMTSEEVSGSWKLPPHHTDPFDRLLVWQAIQKNLTLISKDSSLEAYKAQGLNLVW